MKQLKQQFVDSWHELRKTKCYGSGCHVDRDRCDIRLFLCSAYGCLSGLVFPVFPNDAGIDAVRSGGWRDHGRNRGYPEVSDQADGTVFLWVYTECDAGTCYLRNFFSIIVRFNLGRVVAAKITVALLVNLLLGTWWLTILYGKGFLAILPARFIKQVVSVPIDSVIFYVLAKTLERQKRFL